MRYKYPEHNSWRVIKAFAILPIEAGEELRWLETCYILQCYSKYRGWNNIRFTTEENYLKDKEEIKKHESEGEG